LADIDGVDYLLLAGIEMAKRLRSAVFGKIRCPNEEIEQRCDSERRSLL
jgi:hypothetical protein